jgi:hypothetical protein
VAPALGCLKEERRMPMSQAVAEGLRRRIAQVASDLSTLSQQHYLSLIGPVEAVSQNPMAGDDSWRLAGYFFGSEEDALTIERAVTIVHREQPLMQAVTPD